MPAEEYNDLLDRLIEPFDAAYNSFEKEEESQQAEAKFNAILEQWFVENKIAQADRAGLQSHFKRALKARIFKGR